MALVNQKSDLKELKYSYFATYGDPPIQKDINNPPKYNRLSKQATARTDDVLRMSRLLTANGGKLSPSASNFLATQATIATVNAINATKKQLQGDSTSFPDTAILDAANNTGKTITGIIAQTAVTGTGLHFIFPPAVGKQYLQEGGPGAPTRGFLRTIGNITGILSKNGVDGARSALEGSTIIPDSLPGYTADKVTSNINSAITFTTPSKAVVQDEDSKSIKSNYKDSNLRFRLGQVDIIDTKPDGNSSDNQFFKPPYLERDKESINAPRPGAPDSDTGNVPFENRAEDTDIINRGNLNVRALEISRLNSGIKDTLEKSKLDSRGKFNPNFSEGYKKGDERTRKVVWTRQTGDQGKYQSDDIDTGRSAIDTFNGKGILSNEVIESLRANELIVSDFDIIPFEFQIFDPSTPFNQNYLYFRAFLEDFSDDFNSEWNSTKYIGRAEELFNYTGFSRSISFSFKLAAFTKQELIPIYQKLNYFASSTAPSYSTDQAFMRGVFSKLTIGDYLQKVPGFFNKISLSWSKEYPWEIGYDQNNDTNTAQVRGQSVDLPRNPTILDVSVGYTPTHDFNPAVGRNFIGSSRQSINA